MIPLTRSVLTLICLFSDPFFFFLQMLFGNLLVGGLGSGVCTSLPIFSMLDIQATLSL